MATEGAAEEEETADVTPGTRRRESAVAFQLPEEPAVRVQTVPDSGRSASHEVPRISLRRPSRAKSAADLEGSERTAPGKDDVDKQDPPREDAVPFVRKTRRLRTGEAVQRCKSDDRAPKEKSQASLAVPSTVRRARSVSNSRLEVDDATEDSSNSPAPVTRKPRRIRTVERQRKSPEPSTSSKSEDETGDNLVPVLRSARRTRTHSPGRQTTVVDPGQEAGHEEERTSILRANRRHRTLSPGSRLGQEPAPRDVDEEDVAAKPTPRANRKTQRLPTFANHSTREAGDAPHSSQAAEGPSKLKSTKTMGPRSLAEAARKAVAAADAEEEERAKSSRTRTPLKAVVDFAGVANAAASAARKARRRMTIARKETTATPAEAEEEKPPPAPRDLELIRMTFSNARRGLAMAREAMSLQIVSPFFLLKTVIKSLGKAALIIKEKRRARGWKILRVFLAAKKRQDFLKAQQEYNSRIQLDDIMEEHLNNIFWQFVIFEVDAYEEILQELVKVFAEPGAGVKEDLPALRQQLERHLQSLEQELQDRILAGDRESNDTASKTRSDMRKSLEKIMSEAATLRSLVVYSRQISRVGRTEKNTALADARLLDDIKNLQVSRRLMRKMKRQEREQKRLEAGKPPLRRRRRRNAGGKGSRTNSKGRSSSKTKKEEQADAGSSSSSSSDSSGSSSDDDYSDSEGDESEDQTDDESVQVEGPQEDPTQDADVFESCRAESVATPLTLGESTECPDDAQRATPLEIGVTPPLLPLPEEPMDADTEPSESPILPIRTVSGASISLGPQWSRVGSKASVAGESSHERYLIEEAADVEAKAVVHSSVDWQATVAEFMVGRRAEDYVVLDRDQLIVPMFHEDWTQQLHSTVEFPVTIQHREASLVVEYSTQWTKVVGSYMAGRDLEDYDVFDSREELIPLFEEVWKPSMPLPSFPIRIQRKESGPGSPTGTSAVSSRDASKKRTTAARRRRYGNAIFCWEEVEGLTDEATPEPGDPARTLTTDAEALQAFDDLFNEGSESRTDCFVDQSFAWLEESVLPQKVKLNLEKCRSRPLGQVPIKMPFLLRRGRLRATTAFSTPRQYEVDSEEAESTLGSVKRVKKAHDNCPSLDEVCELREQNAESERIIHSWRENKAAAPIPKLSLKPVLGRSKVPWEDSPHLANMPFGHIAKPRFNRFPPDVEPRSQAAQSSTSGSARRHLRGTQMLGKTRSRPWQVKDERRQMFPLVSFHRSLCKVQV